MADQPTALRLADALGLNYAHLTAVPEINQQAAAELRRLHAENESLKRALAASCDEERDQLWEASPGGGCSRARSAEAVNRELLKALKAVCTHAPRSSQQIEADWNKARAAIAKAEGEKT